MIFITNGTSNQLCQNEYERLFLVTAASIITEHSLVIYTSVYYPIKLQLSWAWPVHTPILKRLIYKWSYYM